AATGAIALPIGMRLAAPHLFLPSLAASALVLALAIPIIARRGMEPTLLAFATVVCAFACAWGFFVATLPAHEERRAEHRRLAESLLPAIHIDQLATYGLFSRRLALGFFIGRPVIYIDREKKLLDYLTPGRRGFCLMEGIEYDRLKNALPPTVVSAGRYRYRHNELVLIKNR
ncbi:MAG: hypothetical protein NT045_07380, partial [Candidatus Aureabacteria bacterium]|nr:hypothetical protein [Candidatus Auribacterota bacterium]